MSVLLCSFALIGSLELLGLSEDDLIRYPIPSAHVIVELHGGASIINWIMPDPIEGEMISAQSPFFPPASVLPMIRHEMQRIVELVPSSPDLIVYVTRGSSGYRSITNDHHLIMAMMSEFGPERVRVHRGSIDEALIDQIRMFGRAAVIVGPHGSGLANIVFAQPQCTLISFPLSPHSYHFYEQMTAALNNRHVIMSVMPPCLWSGTYGILSEALIHRLLDTIHEALRPSSHRQFTYPTCPS